MLHKFFLKKVLHVAAMVWFNAATLHKLTKKALARDRWGFFVSCVATTPLSSWLSLM